MTDWSTEVERLVAADFSGVVSVSRGADVLFEAAYGLADRAHRVPCTPQTRFATASGTKSFTALVVMGLVTDGLLSPATTARSVLGSDLPLIADDVTIEQLLTHTSGIGDYADEDLDELPPLKVPVYELVTTADYLPALDGFPQKFAAGTRFTYCNSGFVVLALIAERVARQGFHEQVDARVFGPAGMTESGFLRSDELPGDAAIGYLADGRTNVFMLPVRGNGDGGAYSTAADLRRFWGALDNDVLVPPDVVAEMTRPHAGGPPDQQQHYGLGFWLDGPAVELHGGDYGVSCVSSFEPSTGATCTVIANLQTPIRALVRKLRDLVSTTS